MNTNALVVPEHVTIYQTLNRHVNFLFPDASRVALEFGSFCTKSEHPNAVCAEVHPLVAQSVQGFLGKRAGALCTAMKECNAAELAECALATTGAVPEGGLDLCTAEGTTGGQTKPDGALIALPGSCAMGGSCDAVKPADGYVCDNVTIGQTCVCNKGVDTCTPYASCIRTSCKVCNDCLADMRNLSSQLNSSAAYATPAGIAAIFSSACLAANHSSALCQDMQLRIAASSGGRLGMRPAALCRLMGECPANLASSTCAISTSSSTGVVPFTILDYCSTDGVNSSSTAPGVVIPTAPLDAGRCLESASCSGEASQCSAAADGKEWCTCSNGTDICRPLGVCVQTSCDLCKSCVKKVATFVSQQQASNDPAAIAANYGSNCTTTFGKAPALCDSIVGAISRTHTGAMGKRAGLLCAALQDCSKDCNITTMVGTTNVTRALGLCSMEGVEGGTSVSNIGSYFTVPLGRCFLSEDCRSADLMCSMSGATETACTCADGVDDCRDVGRCVPTPCKGCSNCLAEWRLFAGANLNRMDPVMVAEAFKTACDASGRSPAACSAVKEAIAASPNGNLGKRAAAICGKLKECEATALDASCMLTARTLDGKSLAAPVSNMSFCTLEGLPGKQQ